MKRERGSVYRVAIPFTGENFFLDRNDFVIIDGPRLLHLGKEIPYRVKPSDLLFRHLELVRPASRLTHQRPWTGRERRRYGYRHNNS